MPISKEKAKLYLDTWKEISEWIRIKSGNKCELCGVNNHAQGWRDDKGRFFEIDEDIRRLILAKAPSSEIKALALTKGMKSLGEMGREKVLQGISTTEEVRRVIYTGKD